MKTAARIFLYFLAGLMLTAISVHASDPVGIYAVVDRVVLEPNDTFPERIQIWGTFSLWENYGDVYGAPQKGYLYYKFAPNSNAGKVERAEWADLKAVAGTGHGIAFGQRHSPAGRIRSASEKAAAPDPYPLGMGITKVGFGGYKENMQRVIADLKKAGAKK